MPNQPQSTQPTRGDGRDEFPAQSLNRRGGITGLSPTGTISIDSIVPPLHRSTSLAQSSDIDSEGSD